MSLKTDILEWLRTNGDTAAWHLSDELDADRDEIDDALDELEDEQKVRKEHGVYRLSDSGGASE